MIPVVAHKHSSPSLIKLFESNPELFVRCDRDGRENPNGGFWFLRDDAAKN
jgi:hypothetical protein